MSTRVEREPRVLRSLKQPGSFKLDSWRGTYYRFRYSTSNKIHFCLDNVTFLRTVNWTFVRAALIKRTIAVTYSKPFHPPLIDFVFRLSRQTYQVLKRPYKLIAAHIIFSLLFLNIFSDSVREFVERKGKKIERGRDEPSSLLWLSFGSFVGDLATLREESISGARGMKEGDKPRHLMLRSCSCAKYKC